MEVDGHPVVFRSRGCPFPGEVLQGNIPPFIAFSLPLPPLTSSESIMYVPQKIKMRSNGFYKYFQLILLLWQRSTDAFTATNHVMVPNGDVRRTKLKGSVATSRTCLWEGKSISDQKATPKKKSAARNKQAITSPQHDNNGNDNKAGIKRTTFSSDENRKINQGITQQETAIDLLAFISSKKRALTTKASGGVMNSVNFSTAFHRIARHVNNMQSDDPRNERAAVLRDPRFALLMCSSAEAMLEGSFGAREMSNIAWAIAKLKVTPPQTVMPLVTSDNVEKQLGEKSDQVRALIIEVAKNRKNDDRECNQTPWIPALSELSALMLDTISYRVIGVNPNAFRLQEWANLLWALATTGRGDIKIVDFILRSLVKGQDIDANNSAEGHRPQEWSNSLWALATSGIWGPEEHFIPFVSSLMDSNPGFLKDFKPQELSNTVWGVATILSKRPGQASGKLNDAALSICRHVSKQLIMRKGQGFKTQELTNMLWAFATLGFGLTMDSELADRADYTFLSTDDLEGDSALSREAAAIMIEDVKTRIRKYRSQELNNLCWVTARMGLQDDELMGQMGEELSDPRRKVTSQDLGTTLWGMASSDFSSPGVYEAIVARWTPEMASRAKPQELSNSVWALASAEVQPKYVDAFDTTILSPRQRGRPSHPREDPVITIFALAAQEVIKRPQDFKAQELKDVLWAFSRLGIRHPDLFRFVAEYLIGSKGAPGRSFKEFSIQAVGNTAWAYARQAQLGADTIQRHKGKTLLPRCGGRLAHYIVLFADVGEKLIHELFYCVAEMDLFEFDGMNRMKAQDISNTAWAFAVVGLQHTSFLEAVATQLERRNRQFTQQEMTNSLWALATLDYRPSGLLHRLENSFLSTVRSGHESLRTRTIAKTWKRQELANMAWVCAVFGEFPPDLIRMIYMGLLGVGDDPDPDVVTEIHLSAALGPDEGISATVIMSLTYLQMMMDLDKSLPSFIRLPDDFPDGWLRISQSGTSSGRSSGTTAQTEGLVERRGGGGDLELNKSVLQQNVGAALARIGFEHVDEFVLDIATLSRDYGILGGSVMSSEILSLDMANPSQRVGIEVDGPGHFVTNIDNFREQETGSYQESKIYESTNSSNEKLEIVFGWNGQSSRLVTKINGPTALKLRIFDAIGWKIHNIPFWEWQSVQGNPQAEDEYCRSLLGN